MKDSSSSSSSPPSPSPTHPPSRSPLDTSSSAIVDTPAASPSLLDSNHDHSTRNKNEGFLHHITYPVSYTLSGLLRRLSADEAPTALARALSANYNGAMTDPTTALFHAPQRRLSPFQPPPLTPLTLKGYRDGTTHSSRLLGKALAEEIRLLVPPRVQLVDEWKLVYSLDQNGTSLGSLYGLSAQYMGKRGGFVLVVRDSNQGVFGAYLSDPPHSRPHYYGTGECFLWRAFRLPALPDLSSLPPPPSADTTHMQRSTTIATKNSSSACLASLNVPSGSTNGRATPERIRFKAFPYTGENDYTIFCQQGFLSVGGGDGRYGLWLDQSLAKGISSPCPTFENECLSDEGDKFNILGVELWYIGA